MGANEHMQDAIELSRTELNPAKDNPTDELEGMERGHKDRQQPEVTPRGPSEALWQCSRVRSLVIRS